jgi:orotate phosphoribosyltransferase
MLAVGSGVDHVHVRTVAQLSSCIGRNLWQVPRDVDVVVGIPRSGLLAANLVALQLNLPLTDVQGLCEGRLFEHGKRPLRTPVGSDGLARPRHVLVVDDCVAHGREVDRVRARIAEAGLPHRITYLAVYAFPERPDKVDISFEVVPRPMAFEWSFLHSAEVLRHVDLDMDGVLCVDATTAEDDDGPNYAAFLRDARPLFLPSVEVGCIVTSRLERYRPQTERWLAEHGVRYRDLRMMDVPDAATRREVGAARFKAAVYAEDGSSLFVESSPGQADRIAELTGKPVLLLGAERALSGGDRARSDITRQRVAWWGRRIRRAPRTLARRGARALQRDAPRH